MFLIVPAKSLVLSSLEMVPLMLKEKTHNNRDSTPVLLTENIIDAPQSTSWK